jgi:hypothetical protein
MNEQQQQPTEKGKFYTLAGVKDGSIIGNADHISRIQLNVSTKKGSSWRDRGSAQVRRSRT